MTTMREGPAFPDLGGNSNGARRWPCSRNQSQRHSPQSCSSGGWSVFGSFWAPLRRRRKIWLSLAALGLLVGLGYHLVVPRSYSAYATLYLAQAPGTDPAAGYGKRPGPLADHRSWAACGPPFGRALPQSCRSCWASRRGPCRATTCSGSTSPDPQRPKPSVGRTPWQQPSSSFGRSESKQQTTAADKALENQISSLQQQIGQLSATINGSGSVVAEQQLTTLVSEAVLGHERTRQPWNSPSSRISLRASRSPVEAGSSRRDAGSSIDCQALRRSTALPASSVVW